MNSFRSPFSFVGCCTKPWFWSSQDYLGIISWWEVSLGIIHGLTVGILVLTIFTLSSLGRQVKFDSQLTVLLPKSYSDVFVCSMNIFLQRCFLFNCIDILINQLCLNLLFYIFFFIHSYITKYNIYILQNFISYFISAKIFGYKRLPTIIK